MAANTVLNYDPKKIQLIVGGYIIGGFVDDEFLEVERDVDAYTKYVGVGGETTRIKTTNRSGKLTIKLMQSSPSNDELSLLTELDEFGDAGAVPLLARDGNGSTLFTSVFCWVKRFPKVMWRREVQVYEWVLDTSSLSIFVGGIST